MPSLPELVRPSDTVFAVTSLYPHSNCLCDASRASAETENFAEESIPSSASRLEERSTNARSVCMSTRFQHIHIHVHGLGAVTFSHLVSQHIHILAIRRLFMYTGLYRRSLTSTQLAAQLRTRFQANGEEWKLRTVRAEVALIDAGAAGIAPAVLRHLRGFDALSPAMEMELMQGLAAKLRERGFGVVLHTTNAEGVRNHIVELTRKRFYAMARRSGEKRARFKANSIAAVLEGVLEFKVLVAGCVHTMRALCNVSYSTLHATCRAHTHTRWMKRATRPRSSISSAGP